MINNCEERKKAINEAKKAKDVLTKMQDDLKQELTLIQKGCTSNPSNNKRINQLREQISHYDEQIKITDADIARWTYEYNRIGCGTL